MVASASIPHAPPPVVTVEAARWTLAIAVGSAFLFIVVSRFSEVAANVFGTAFKVAFILSLLSFILALSSGRLPETLRTPTLAAMAAFTMWWLACVPFSVWPGGSVGLLQGRWIFDVVTFLALATLPVSSSGLNLYAGSMAWSAIFVNFTLLRYGVSNDDRGSVDFTSSLSNPNIAALQLLLGLPFLVYWTRFHGFFSFRGLAGFASAILLAFLIVTRTGSRSGLLILVVVTLMLMSGTKIFLKIALFFALIFGTAVVIPFIPSYLIYRYGTLLSTAEDDQSEAAASSRERHAMLLQSLVLTMQHPVFGVGAGQFKIAQAAISHDKGEREAWLETHNMYTQLSSETGLPGVALYLTMIVFSLAPVFKELRAAKRAKQLLPRHEYARALLISATALAINSCFTSVAYEYYWPVVCGLGVAYQRVVAAEKSPGAVVLAAGPKRRGPPGPPRLAYRT